MSDIKAIETATDRLRALLDEHDVEHYDGIERTLWGYEPTGEDTGIYRYAASEISGGFLQFDMFRVTPEQAIVVTLGSDNAFTREEVESAFVRGYSLGSLPVGSDPQWDENIQTVDEHMAELGWVRSAAIGGGTCCIVKTPSDSDFSNDWRYRCSECGCSIPVNERDPDTGDVINAANYCPNCGAKVVDE